MKRDDWFASHFIVAFASMFVLGMIGLIFWELEGAKAPLMNLRLFKFRNFAICCFLMLLVGGILNAGTVLQPQFLQQMLGYTATKSGQALTWGGVALVLDHAAGGVSGDQAAGAEPDRAGICTVYRGVLVCVEPPDAGDQLWLCAAFFV